ncbi:MAG: hypothetical protein OD817_02465 [Gammaproteobacteria bacterium]
MSFDTCEQFLDAVFKAAHTLGYPRELGKDGWQIEFGEKGLHEGHLAELYPEVLEPGADVSSLINEVAPGRECVHKAMGEILEKVFRG